MSGENIKEGLEGLSKIDGFTDILFIAIYWVAVIFLLLLIAYIFSSIGRYLNRKRRGENKGDNDDFLE
jgi:preprotein translocase subunit SecG